MKKNGLIFKRSSFSKFADEVKASYPESIVSGARELAYKILKAKDPKEAEEFNKQFDAEERRGISRRKKLGLLFAGLAISTALGLGYYLSRDKTPPKIHQVEYQRNLKPGDYATVKVNASDTSGIASARMLVVDPQNRTQEVLGEKENGLYVFKFKLTQEPSYNFTIFIDDPFGNEATFKGGITCLDNPEISSLSIRKIPELGLCEVKVNASDTSGIKKALIEFDGMSLPMVRLNDTYAFNITLGWGPRSLGIKVHVFDPFNQSVSEAANVDWSLKDAFIYFSSRSGFDSKIAESFYEKYPSLVSKLYSTNKPQIAYPLELYSKAPDVFDEIYKSVKEDPTVVTNKELFTALTSKLFLDLNYKDFVKVFNPATGNYEVQKLKPETVQAIVRYAVAVEKLNLPPHSVEDVWLFGNATQICGDIADFTPLTFYSVYGENVVLCWNPPRDTWAIVKFLKNVNSSFPVLKFPEIYEGINMKVKANLWSIFDADFGIAYSEKINNNRELKLTDEDVWDLMMLQWNLYSNKAPQFGGGGKLYNRDFQWYNSTQLKQLYPDGNTRNQGLFFLFFMSNTSFDMEKRERVYGIKGAKTALIQGEKEYETISRLYPNGTIKNWLGDVDVRWYYYDWLEDRGVHGLENTHMQYVGLKPMELWNVMTSHPLDFWNYLKDYKGIDQYLTKNWKYWDLVKFIAGYERWNVGNYPPATEEDGDNYLIPQTLQAFGFPVYFVHINPTPKGAAQYEWVISLPDHVATGMKSEFGESILIGLANGFGLYLTKDGIVKDGIRELRGFVGETTFYQDKDGTVKSNTLLAPEIEVYLMKKD